MAKKQFKAESKRLLDMMINSIYTHKEIFLRELISNASDAIDKLAYAALTDDKVGLSRSDFAIWLTPDKDARTLTIEDNGIGMTREELESNLGTIAKSGSLKFKEELAEKEGEKGDVDVIGQFGVGFYSAFMVADKVTVTSRVYGSDEAWQWESSGADGYTVTESAKESAGTKIVLHIKENAEGEDYDQFLSQYTLQSLVKKYSDYVRFPIKMAMEKSRQTEKPADSGEVAHESRASKNKAARAEQKAEAASASTAPALKPEVAFADFEKLDLRIGRVAACEIVPKSAKLLNMTKPQ